MDPTFNIINFLQRPVELDRFELGPTSANADDGTLKEVVIVPNSQPVFRAYTFPSDLMKKGNKIQKLLNHQYFKADIHVKVVLNTNAFVAGRLYLSYSPYEDQIADKRKQLRASRAGVTAYPGVEIDVQTGSSFEMIIPYASYKEAYVLTVEKEDYVKMHLFKITPILGNTAGQGTVDMTIFAWFENVVLNIPTYKNIALTPDNNQLVGSLSGVDKERLAFARKFEKYKKLNPAEYERIRPYIERVSAVMQIQAEAFASGPISSIASTVKDVASIVGGVPIPIVSEVASTVGWVSDIVGSIASIFGWSRPNSMRQVCALQNVPGKFYTHVEAEDQSVSLSLTGKNELGIPLNVFPSGVDEMDLGYVCANPAVKAVWKWSTQTGTVNKTPIGLLPVGIGPYTGQTIEGDANSCSSLETEFSGNEAWAGTHEDGLLDYRAFNRTCGQPWVSPGVPSVEGIFAQAKGTPTLTILDTAPCEYVSQLFTYWRATVCFKISVVKTAFHTGRLEIFFEPGMYNHFSTPIFPPDLESYQDIDTCNNYKYILDLTQESEVTIKIPFVSERLFLNTNAINGGNDIPTVQQVADSLVGAIIVRPLTNLMCPETVSQSVNLVIWKWAEDVVLVDPIASNNQELKIYTGQSVGKDICPSPIDMKTLTKQTLNNLTYVSAQRVKANMQISVGNAASGNVFVFFQTNDVEGENMKACQNAVGERTVSLRPLLRVFRRYIDGYSDTTPLTMDLQKTFSSAEHVDYLEYISYMYRFFRGGVRYKVETVGGNRVSSVLHQGAEYTPRIAPSHITYPSLNPFHEVSVPYYSQYRKLPISIRDNIMNVTFKVDLEDEGKFNGNVLRAGNDDLTYGWLMGTPQLITSGTGVIWNQFVKTKDSGKVLNPVTDPSLKGIPGPNNNNCPAPSMAVSLGEDFSLRDQYVKNEIADQRLKKMQARNFRTIRSISEGIDEVDDGEEPKSTI